jgi:hypothetical protein
MMRIGTLTPLAAGFEMFYPKVRRTMSAKLQAVYDKYQLQRPFPKSAYPGLTINFGPRTVCHDHLDCTNAAGVPCAITALGDFDHHKGGHLVLFDLKLIVPFPSGSTILLPSASLRHGNLGIQDGETRMSMTQYCSGGLLRHYDYGFKMYKGENGMSEAKRKEVDASAQRRWEEVMARFSTLDSLLDDYNV